MPCKSQAKTMATWQWMSYSRTVLFQGCVPTCGCPGQRDKVDAWEEDELPHARERQEEDGEGDALQQLGAAKQRQPQRQPCPPACTRHTASQGPDPSEDMHSKKRYTKPCCKP